SLFGEPAPGLPTTPPVALLTRESRTCCGLKAGLAPSTSAAAPTTCGVAIDVPLIVLVAVSLVFHAEVIPTPGAKMSRQVPKLENDAFWSLLWVAPTVIAAGTRAGEVLQASCGLPKMSPLPAAIPYVTPEAMEFETALSSVASAPPPRLMFATAGLTACWVTQSTPAVTPPARPLPVPSRHLTAHTPAAFAAP